MKKIAILSGTFDPFHLAHLAMAETVIEEGIADKVLIVPTIVDYHKPYGHTSWLLPGDRLYVIREMINRSVCREHIEIDCADYDALDKIRPEYRESFQAYRRFINTLIEIKGKYPADTEFLFIIGTDQAYEFHNWFQYEQILKLATPVVFNGRAEQMLELDRIFRPYEFIELKLDPSKYGFMSSTKIRKEMKGKSPSYYLDHLGEELIAETPIFDLVRKPEVQAGFRPVGLNCPDWVTVIATRKCTDHKDVDTEVLMVRQLRYGVMQEMEEFVCGQVEPNESPETAAIRELEEETGYRIPAAENLSRVRELGSLYPNPAFQNNTMHYYWIVLDGLEPGTKKLDEHEKIETFWSPIADAEAHVRTGLMAAGLHLLNEYKEKKNGK